MAGTTVLGRLTWQVADVVGVVEETATAKRSRSTSPGWPGHRAGQHVDVRLTADDGYQAERSYSIASAPDGTQLELTVERIDDGEVSPYLTDELRPGDQIELRGPIGGYFVWGPPDGGPLLLVAGGSGVAPLMAMIRTRAPPGPRWTRGCWCPHAAGTTSSTATSSSGATAAASPSCYTLTASQPPGWTGYARRVDAGMLAEVGPGARAAATHLRVRPDTIRRDGRRGAGALGHEPQHIKTERFGPTGS